MEKNLPLFLYYGYLYPYNEYIKLKRFEYYLFHNNRWNLYKAIKRTINIIKMRLALL